MKILLLGGFLGSGKTTILLQLARHIIGREHTGDGTTIMIIENEIGEVGVDDKLLKSQGLAVRDLFAGCACCTSGGDLLSDIAKIQSEYDPKWIIIEATGVAYPRSIRDIIGERFKLPVRILGLADAARWKRLRNAMADLIVSQLECADCVFVNKADLVDAQVLETIISDIREINADAAIFQTNGTQPLPEEVWDPIMSREDKPHEYA